MRYPWQYDPHRQEFRTPSGTLKLDELASVRHEAVVYGNHTITTGPWAGFRVRGKYLRGRIRGHKVDLTPAMLLDLLQKAGLAG
jgi:hypothetical protein